MTTADTGRAQRSFAAGTERRSEAELRRLLSHVGEDLEFAPAQDILAWAVATFGARLAITSSMNDAVLAHLASTVATDIDILFLDTGYHFAETLDTRDTVAFTLAVNVVNVTAEQTVAEQDTAYGKDLFARDPDMCCALRKVKPLEAQLAGYDAWATGLRRDETPDRADTPVIGWDQTKRKIKLAPLARWSAGDIIRYTEDHGVPVNPLQRDGYPSIGCQPCTRRVTPDEDPRDGRWAGTDKTECGIHQ